jgi:hypothetical protein
MEHIKSQSQGLVTTDREHGHEDTDINVKAIFGFALFLVIGGLVAHVGLWGMYIYLDRQAEKKNEGVSTPVQVQMEEQRPQATEKKSAQSGQVGEKHAETSKEVWERLQAKFPAPRLQDDDVRDMNMLRANEDKMLNGYTWLDKNSGAVRIPVSRAMELLAERGLPNVAAETPQGKGPAVKPTTPPAGARP